MADDKKTNWKRFQRLRIDGRSITKRARRAETSTTRHAHRFVVSKLDSLRNAKQHIIVWLLLVGVLTGAVALQMYWYQQAYRTMAWKEGGTYAEAVEGPIATLNPLYATTNAELSASRLLFSSLFTYDDTGSIADDLATNLTISNDGKEYVVSLRDDVRFSDGTKLTSKDVVHTIDLMKSPEVRSVMFGNWVDVTATALDDRTVKFELPARYASFPHALTFAVLPEHILKDVEPGAIRQSTFSVSPIGSGPFTARLLQNSPDRQHKIANLSANESFYKGKPRLSRVALHAYNSQDDMMRALQTGEVNAVSGSIAARDQLPESFKTRVAPIASGVYALINNEATVFKSLKVRQALQSGTDTAELRESLGYPVPELHLPFVKGQLRGDLPKAPSYSKERAARLLDQAGWRLKANDDVRTNKRGERLSLRVITVENTIYEKVLEQLAGQWRELGIEVNTQASPNRDFVQTKLQPRDYDVLVYELVIGADPDVFAYWHSTQATQTGYNFANYKDDLSDDALASARGTSDRMLRNEKYKSFSEQWLKDVPAIGLYQSVMRYTYRPSVQPLIPQSGMPTDIDRYANIRYWSAQQAPVYKTP